LTSFALPSSAFAAPGSSLTTSPVSLLILPPPLPPAAFAFAFGRIITISLLVLRARFSIWRRKVGM